MGFLEEVGKDVKRRCYEKLCEQIDKTGSNLEREAKVMK